MNGPCLYLNSYAPLVIKAAGREASARFRLPPFIDGSVRREPDLEHDRPSISCLCRGSRFAPRLRPGDVVVYMTKKAKYGEGPRHQRVTAILRVALLFNSHREAADWYRAEGMSLPSNCVVEGNPPFHVSKTHRSNENSHITDDDEFTRRWDVGYRHRARQHGRFVACEAIWRDLDWTAPKVHDSDLEAVFSMVPATRNPGTHSISRLKPLLTRLGIDALPSGR